MDLRLASDRTTAFAPFISNPTIAWSSATVAPAMLIHPLSTQFLHEAHQNRHRLGEEIPCQGRDVENTAFPALRREADYLRRARLLGGSGAVILRGLTPQDYSQIELENIFWRLCNALGRPFVQKGRAVRFGRVEDLGRAAESRPRYHETGAGGSVHTDSPIMRQTADMVGLLCVRAAARGGDSKFVSVASVHNTLLRHAPSFLQTLYQPFFFDRRIGSAQITPDHPALLLEPIFSYRPALGERGLRLRWQPEYVWDAPRLPGAPALGEEQRLALHLLEGILEDRSGALTVSLSMQPGDIQLVNNHLVAHGRTPFFEEPRAEPSAAPAGRLMRRVWLHDHR